MQKKHIAFLVLLGILCIAAFFRFYNINWDSGNHLHPDERFLVMVANDMKMPTSLAQYLDPQVSTLNPTNINFKFYVYGTFPVVLNKLIAQITANDNYAGLSYQGRLLSAFFDLLTVAFLFKLLFLLKKHRNLPREIVFFGPIFYALAVMPIQLSHFFAVDTFLNFFLLASFYCILKFYYEKSIVKFFAGSIFFALAVASKISAIYILPLLLFIIFLSAFRQKGLPWPLSYLSFPRTRESKSKIGSWFGARNDKIRNLWRGSALLLIFFILFYLTLRVADPYYFADANFLHIKPNPVFIENLQTLKSYSQKEGWFPPSVQWINKTPVVFSLYNLAFFGLGLFYFLLVPVGIFFLLKKHRAPELTALFIWVGLFFLYQSTQLAQTMRYYIILYPFFALSAAAGFHYLFGKLNPYARITLLLLLLAWPLCFLSVYAKPMTRVEASYWIYSNIPQGSTILGELWDDALPLPLPGGNQYDVQLLPVFDYDTDEKWKKMDELLEKGDYYILASNRAWGSIPTVPERYPKMTKFYKALFAGKLNFKKIKDFTSYPSLSYLGIPLTIQDDMADESFTVYDHPRVIIFQKIK